MKVLFDTNLWISFMIGKRLATLADVLCRNDVHVQVDNVCYWTPITIQAKSPIRDIKDIFILSMAESVPVDCIVSGDKDLTELKSHAGIPILQYSEFLNKIDN